MTLIRKRKQTPPQSGSGGGQLVFDSLSALSDQPILARQVIVLTGPGGIPSGCPPLDCVNGTYGQFILPPPLQGSYTAAAPTTSGVFEGETIPTLPPANTKEAPVGQPFAATAFSSEIIPGKDDPKTSQSIVYDGSSPYTFNTHPVPGARVCASPDRVILDFTNVSGEFQAFGGPQLFYCFSPILSAWNVDALHPNTGAFFPKTLANGQPFACTDIAPSAPHKETMNVGFGWDYGLSKPVIQYTYRLTMTWGARVRLLACDYIDRPNDPNTQPYSNTNLVKLDLIVSQAWGRHYFEYQSAAPNPHLVISSWPTSCGDGDGGFYDIYVVPIKTDTQTYKPSDFGSPGNAITFSRVFQVYEATIDNGINTAQGVYDNGFENLVDGWFPAKSIRVGIRASLNITTLRGHQPGPIYPPPQPLATYTKEFQYALVLDDVRFSYTLEQLPYPT